jgi:hypothetical protein
LSIANYPGAAVAEYQMTIYESKYDRKKRADKASEHTQRMADAGWQLVSTTACRRPVGITEYGFYWMRG